MLSKDSARELYKYHGIMAELQCCVCNLLLTYEGGFKLHYYAITALYIVVGWLFLCNSFS